MSKLKDWLLIGLTFLVVGYLWLVVAMFVLNAIVNTLNAPE